MAGGRCGCPAPLILDLTSLHSGFSGKALIPALSFQNSNPKADVLGQVTPASENQGPRARCYWPIFLMRK